MVKTATQLQDIDTSLETRLPAIVQLSKVAAPYTTVQNRAQVTNFAADLLPRFGVDRVTIQAIQEVQGEYGPNGERVFKPVNDVHDAVRLVGIWIQNVNISGQYLGTGGAAANTDFVEITFYGTGLNLITITGNTTLRTLAVSVDGGSSSTVQWDTATNSSIKTNRNYNTNDIVSIVQGLSVGLHTVKIQQNNNTNFFVTGYEVINANSTLQQTAGTSYAGGQRLYASALTTSSPTSGFTNTYGTPGTRGGHVLVYQKSDGTIAKDIRYTETAAAYLTSANHTNEEVIRTHHWREFGAGRTDDFSSLTTVASNRVFTLDDGTTTLLGVSVTQSSYDSCAIAVDNTGYLTLTFVGTGLDITWSAGVTGTNTNATAFSVVIDGVNQGNWETLSPGAQTQRVKKICSGLPYGTHTVRISRGVADVWSLTIHNFIVYAPKVPVLPTGAVALADYFVMADYAADTTYGNAYRVSTGVMRKMLIREAIYSGTWAIASLDPNFADGINLRSNTAASYVEYTFVGTGINFRMYLTTGAINYTFSIDGAAPTTSTFGYPGTGLTYTAGTGVLSGTAAGTSDYGGSLWSVTGLTFGVHKLRVTFNSGNFLYADAFDVITPIHAPKLNGPFVVQNTLAVGSCAVRDLREFGEEQIPEYKNSSQAVGVNGSASTTSTTAIPVPDMSVVIKTSGKPIQIDYRITANHGTAAGGFLGYIYVNGVQVGTSNVVNGPNSGYDFCVSDSFKVPVAAGYHKVDIYYNTAAGTLSLSGTRRNLTVQEI